MRQVTDSYFSDRAPVISPEQSMRIVQGLQQIGLLDSRGNFKGNPKDDDVRGAAGSEDSSMQAAAAAAAATKGCLSAMPPNLQATCTSTCLLFPISLPLLPTSAAPSLLPNSPFAEPQVPCLSVDLKAAQTAALAEERLHLPVHLLPQLTHPAVAAGGLRQARARGRQVPKPPGGAGTAMPVAAAAQAA